MFELSGKEKKILIIIIFFLLAGAGMRIYSSFSSGNTLPFTPTNSDGENLSASEPLKVPEIQPTVIPTPAEKPVIAHVCGAVNKTGVYTLPADSRVKDFIEAAGGTTEKADLDRINLARIVEDGEQIAVPEIGSTDTSSGSSATSPVGSVEDFSQKLPDNTETSSSKVNINTGDLEELEGLPHIGPSIAQKIIDYRKTNGNFKTIEDIKNVKGIGDKTFEDIKDFIYVN